MVYCVALCFRSILSCLVLFDPDGSCLSRPCLYRREVCFFSRSNGCHGQCVLVYKNTQVLLSIERITNVAELQSVPYWFATVEYGSHCDCV